MADISGEDEAGAAEAMQAEQPADETLAGQKRSPSRAGRIGKYFLLAVGAVLALVLAGLLFFNTPIGKRLIVDEIAKIAPESGLRFEVGRIEGNIYGKSTLRHVTISDPKGAFLTIPEVEFDWRPLSWIWSGLDIRELTMRRATLLRTPELLPGDPDAPILPDFDIRVDQFEIDDLTVAKGVIGDTAPVIDVLAQLDIRAGRMFLDLDSNLGPKDRLSALIDAKPDGDKFDLKLDYNAPENGLLAGLLGKSVEASKGASYSAKIGGEGSWKKWDGFFVIKRNEERFAAFKVGNRGGDYSLLGQAFPASVLTGLPAQAVGEKLSIKADASLDKNRLDGKYTIVGRAFDFAGAGLVDLTDNNVQDFRVFARLTDPALFGANMTLKDAQAEATLNGSFRDLAINHKLSVGEVRTDTARIAGLTQQGEARYDGTRWVLPLAVKMAAIETGNAQIDPKLTSGTIGGNLVYSGSRLQSDGLAIAFPDISARLALRGDIAANSYQLTGPVEVRKLAVDNVGMANANAKIDFQLAGSGAWALRSNFSARIPRVTNASLANVAGPDITVKGSASMGSNSPFDFRNVQLNSANLAMTLSGKMDQGTVSLAGRGTQADYGPFTVNATVGAAGPRAVLMLASPLPAAGLKDVRVAIAPARNGFSIDTAGQSLLGEFAGQLGLTLPAKGPTRIDITQLRVWKTEITGALELASTGGSTGANGQLLLSGGGLDGQIDLAARDGGQSFSAKINALRAQFGGEAPLSIGRAQMEGSGFFKTGHSTIDANITAEGISYGGLFVGRLAAAADLTNGAGSATASISGRRGNPFAMQINTEITPESATSPAQYLVAARGEFGGRRISMPRRALLTQPKSGGWQLAPFQISYGGGMAIVSGEFTDASTSFNFAFDKMPLALADLAVTDIGLRGRISGKMEYRRHGKAMPHADIQVKINDLSRTGLVLSSPPIDVELTSRLTASELELTTVFEEDGERNGSLQARISNLAQSGALADDLIGRLRQGDLSAQLKFDGQAASLWRLSGVEAFDVTGPVSVAANVTGNLADPRVLGSLEGKDLNIQSALSGTNIRSASVIGAFNGSRLQLQKFSGTAENGGAVSGSGFVGFEDLGVKGPTMDLRIAAKNAKLLDVNGLDATITGPLRIVSDGNGGTIAGRIEIDRASWALGSAAAAEELPQIATTEINLPFDIAPAQAPAKPWRYLIDAKAESRVDVDGMGLDSEWRADIQLRGTTLDPRIGGGAEVVRGSYSFAGTRFELTKGKIDFDVAAPIDPRVDIVAETKRDGLEVAVKVQGNALSPEITFNSTPALPEEEILAGLLFGGSISNLSATDALQLGAALASLRGGGGLDPINKLRTAIGLDRLRIVSADPALDRGTSVAIGKNIGRRLYVEIITDGQGYSATEAEFRITSWLSLLGSVSTLGRQSAVLEVSRDY